MQTCASLCSTFRRSAVPRKAVQQLQRLYSSASASASAASRSAVRRPHAGVYTTQIARSAHARDTVRSMSASDAAVAPPAVCESLRTFEVQDLVSLQIKACERFGDQPLFGTKNGPKFDWTSYTDFNKMVQRFRHVLQKHNIGVNDKVALISNNRVEWAVAYYATLGMGGQIVPMYEAQMEKDWKFIVEDSDAKLLLVANERIYDRTKTFISPHSRLKSILSFDADPALMHSYGFWMDAAAKEASLPAPFVPSDPCNHTAAIIYTSGTTGLPKGVELTHTNIVSNLAGLDHLWGEQSKLMTSTVCFLPWSHVFGQVAELNRAMGTGCAMALAPSRETLLECISIVKPSAIISVPILFNRVYDGVMKKFEEESPLKRKFIKWAFKVSRKRNELLEFGRSVPALLNLEHTIADKLVFSKIRERMGGRLHYMAAGGAATSLTVLQFFEDIGVPICEGYGLTETSPVISSGTVGWEKRRLGCVGVMLDGVTVKIVDPDTLQELPAQDEDGEICVNGPNVMRGYRNNEEANKEVFFYLNGMKYFRTGDMGRIVDGRFLKVTGRIKEQYKLENGKYVVPIPIEDAICRSHFILQGILFGSNKAYNVFLAVPDMPAIRAWAAKQPALAAAAAAPASPEGDAQLVAQPQVQQLISDEIMSASGQFKPFERPHKWAAVMEPFSQENNMLTPKMSVRRKNVVAAYEKLIADIYEGRQGALVKNG